MFKFNIQYSFIQAFNSNNIRFSAFLKIIAQQLKSFN